jgi:hypothetical protein
MRRTGKDRTLYGRFGNGRFFIFGLELILGGNFERVMIMKKAKRWDGFGYCRKKEKT